MLKQMWDKCRTRSPAKCVIVSFKLWGPGSKVWGCTPTTPPGSATDTHTGWTCFRRRPLSPCVHNRWSSQLGKWRAWLLQNISNCVIVVLSASSVLVDGHAALQFIDFALLNISRTVGNKCVLSDLGSRPPLQLWWQHCTVAMVTRKAITPKLVFAKKSRQTSVRDGRLWSCTCVCQDSAIAWKIGGKVFFFSTWWQKLLGSQSLCRFPGVNLQGVKKTVCLVVEAELFWRQPSSGHTSQSGLTTQMPWQRRRSFFLCCSFWKSLRTLCHDGPSVVSHFDKFFSQQ